ncbi:MAG: hypothetical protein WBE58_11985 [Verrucomicrobiales bacterium]
MNSPASWIDRDEVARLLSSLGEPVPHAAAPQATEPGSLEASPAPDGPGTADEPEPQPWMEPMERFGVGSLPSEEDDDASEDLPEPPPFSLAQSLRVAATLTAVRTWADEGGLLKRRIPAETEALDSLPPGLESAPEAPQVESLVNSEDSGQAESAPTLPELGTPLFKEQEAVTEEETAAPPNSTGPDTSPGFAFSAIPATGPEAKLTDRMADFEKLVIQHTEGTLLALLDRDGHALSFPQALTDDPATNREFVQSVTQMTRSMRRWGRPLGLDHDTAMHFPTRSEWLCLIPILARPQDATSWVFLAVRVPHPIDPFLLDRFRSALRSTVSGRTE